jgi:hypothetical protein
MLWSRYELLLQIWSFRHAVSKTFAFPVVCKQTAVCMLTVLVSQRCTVKVINYFGMMSVPLFSSSNEKKMIIFPSSAVRSVCVCLRVCACARARACVCVNTPMCLPSCVYSALLLFVSVICVGRINPVFSCAYLCGLCTSQNQQRLFAYTPFTDWLI